MRIEIYETIENKTQLVHFDPHTNLECEIGVNIQLTLQDFYDHIQHCAKDEIKA